jgi:hypothetical protein
MKSDGAGRAQTSGRKPYPLILSAAQVAEYVPNATRSAGLAGA